MLLFAKSAIDIYLIHFLFILGVIYALISLFEFLGNSSSEKNYVKKTNSAALIRQVIYWCKDEMGLPPNVKSIPEVKISYYKHQKYAGLYHTQKQCIIIYPKSNDSLLKLVDSVIHEYVHFLEMRSPKDAIAYSKFQETHGYINNPYEVSARKIAAEKRDLCMQYLLNNNFIIKA